TAWAARKSCILPKWVSFQPVGWVSFASVLTDISGQYVLVADTFYYFGAHAISIPAECRPWLPKGQSAHGRLTPPEQALCFIQYIKDRYQPGLHSNPTDWPEDEVQTKTPCRGRRCGSS
ncbi:hypothetical protein HU806_21440, partial [Pseudomonas sp. SWRI154]|nr:hypothetical protein [Pseudomonas sp. SWRI154]